MPFVEIAEVLVSETDHRLCCPVGLVDLKRYPVRIDDDVPVVRTDPFDRVSNTDLFESAKVNRPAGNYGGRDENGDERSCEESNVTTAAALDEINEAQGVKSLVACRRTVRCDRGSC